MYKEDYYPINRGFDEHMGYLQGCLSQSTHVANCCDAPTNATNFTDYVCPAPGPGQEDWRGYDWFNGTTPVLNDVGLSSTSMISSLAESYIAKQAANDPSSPFFLYLPFQNIHAPYDCQQESFELFSNQSDISDDQKVIYGYLYELDQAIGNIVATLNNNPAVAENTVIIFASDNVSTRLVLIISFFE